MICPTFHRKSHTRHTSIYIFGKIHDYFDWWYPSFSKRQLLASYTLVALNQDANTFQLGNHSKLDAKAEQKHKQAFNCCGT